MQSTFKKLSVPPLKLQTKCIRNLLLKILRITPQPQSLLPSAYAIYFPYHPSSFIPKNSFSNLFEIVENHVAQSTFKDYPPRIILTLLHRVVEKKDPWPERK